METKKAPYTFVKDGYFYFSRRIPSDLRAHYQTDRIVEALRTRSVHVARGRATVAAAKLDEYWALLRLSHSDLPGRQFLRRKVQQGQGFSVLPTSPESVTSSVSVVSPWLSDAVARYVDGKGAGKGEAFQRAAERACGYLIDAAGEKELAEYTRVDALALRDFLVERGLSGSSITRVFGSIRAVVNFNISELALEIGNPFLGVYYDRSKGVKKRATLPIEMIRTVQERCRFEDDEKRWLIAMVSDSGARLAEIAGLCVEDIRLDGKSPHIVIQPHAWRSLKTKGSERLVPLTGVALWAAHRVVQASGRSQFAFPSYNKTDRTNANSASGALNKWLKTHVGQGYTIHGFRHAMRDRLRSVECPSDIVDQIGGWTTEGVGQGYGTGYPLDVLFKWLSKATETRG